MCFILHQANSDPMTRQEENRCGVCTAGMFLKTCDRRVVKSQTEGRNAGSESQTVRHRLCSRTSCGSRISRPKKHVNLHVFFSLKN